MSTRSGARYHPKNPKSSHKIDFNFAAAFKDITERLNAIGGGSVQNLNARVGTLEEERMNGMEERVRNTPPLVDYPRERHDHLGFDRGHNQVIRSHHDHNDQDKRILQSVKVEVPSFMGCLDPNEYLDWEADMIHYFEWYDMSEERKIRFAKIKLLDQAKLY